MGVTAQAISKWERGLSLPDIGLLNGICDVLDVDANTLLNVTAKSRITENDDALEQKKLLSSLCAEPVKVIFGKDLIPTFVDGLKTKLISEKRLQTAGSKGILIPIIRIKDDVSLKDNEFCILSYDKLLYREELREISDTAFTYIIDKLFQICEDNYAYSLSHQGLSSGYIYLTIKNHLLIRRFHTLLIIKMVFKNILD